MMGLDYGWDGKNEYYNRPKTFWQKEFAILPHTCHRTGKTIWLQWAYKSTTMLTGPGDVVFESTWVTEEQFIIMMLKGL